MHKKNRVEDYKRIQSELDLDQIYLHKGWGRLIGNLYKPVGERSLEEYYDDLITHMNTRVLLDPKRAIGGDWDTAGKHQLDILRSLGLQRDHSLLDFGCGTLRAGKDIIPYLDKGKYTGIDISPEALRSAHDLIEKQGLEEKTPRLIFNDDPVSDEMFPGLEGETFDCIVCLWVCYDMPADVFQRFLHQAIDHMHSESFMVFSWVKRDYTRPPDDKLFSWMHDWRIVDSVVNQRGLIHTELNVKLHPDDEQVVSCLEFKE